MTGKFHAWAPLLQDEPKSHKRLKRGDASAAAITRALDLFTKDLRDQPDQVGAESTPLLIVVRDGDTHNCSAFFVTIEAIPERCCRICGCTEDNACAGGCSWASADVCSACDQMMKGDHA